MVTPMLPKMRRRLAEMGVGGGASSKRGWTAEGSGKGRSDGIAIMILRQHERLCVMRIF